LEINREEFLKTGEKYVRSTDDSLSGRVFHLAMDDGDEYELRFVTGDIVEWRSPGGPVRYEKYGCLKPDEKTFFVASILSECDPLVCVTLVLDEEQSLVTMAVSRQGYYPLRPRLAVVDFRFGAIRVPDRPLPYKRHGFTRDLVGKKINWYYSTGFINTQMYTTERYMRIRPLTDTRTPEEIEREEKEIELGLRPRQLLYEEPSAYIKIKDEMYLLSCIEANMNRVDETRGGNNLMFVANFNKGCDFGRTFSRKGDRLDHGFFMAFGDPTDEEVPLETEPTPYRV